MISLYISNLISVLIFLAYGKGINFFLLSKKENTNNIILDILSGAVYISFVALIINFFYPLNTFINNIILIFSLILFLFLVKKISILKSIIHYTLIIGSISFLIMVLDHTNRPDAGLYHLPYISILNDYKIIFGLSNIHFRFGHTSILQYTSAIFNNSIFLTKGITIPAATVLVTLFIYFFKNLISIKKNYFFLFFYFLISIFIILKTSRYNDIGNDAIGHLFLFLTIAIFLEKILKKDFNYENFFFLSLFSIFAFTNKVFLIFGFCFPLLYIIFSKNFNFLVNKKNIIFIFFILVFFIKNIVVSSCLIYPVKNTCFKSFSWSAVDKNVHSNPEVKSIEGEAAGKAWSDFKPKNLSFEQYKKNFVWFDTWKNKHLKYIFFKLLPIFIVILILILILSKYESFNKKNSYKNLERNFSKKVIITTIIISIVGSIYWFLKFPLFRYGYSYLVSFIVLFTSYYLSYFYTEINFLKVYKILFRLTIIALIFISFKNIQRIYENYELKYVDYPWPKIYSFEQGNVKQNNREILASNNFKIYYPSYRLCMYSQGPCTHYNEVKNEILIKKIANYYFMVPK